MPKWQWECNFVNSFIDIHFSHFFYYVNNIMYHTERIEAVYISLLSIGDNVFYGTL